MPLTPLDIHNKEFNRSLRGYDIDEVNEFLAQVIKDFEILIRDNKEIKEKLANAEEKLQTYVKMEDSLSKSIILAQETAEELKLNAKKEAQLIIKEAEKNADRIINDSLSKSRKIAIEIEELKKRAAVYRTRFRTLVQAQLEMLEAEDWGQLRENEEEAV